MSLKEADLQKSCVKWFRHQYPNILLHHSPNEGKRSPQYMNWLKTLGTLPGCPDILIFEARGKWHGLAIEMKAPGGKLTDNQEWFIQKLQAAGWQCHECRGIEEFMSIVIKYLLTEI